MQDLKGSMDSPAVFRTILLVVVIALSFVALAGAQGTPAGTLKILTYNVYQGTDFASVRALLSAATNSSARSKL